MARSTATAKRPAKASPPGRRTTDADREKRALDNAARRVPVWQVSAVSALMVLSESMPPAPMTDRIKLVLKQVPPAVTRAAEMHRAGRWTPL